MNWIWIYSEFDKMNTINSSLVPQFFENFFLVVPVKETDIILSPYQSVYEEGTSINLRCVAKGEPHPHYFWTFTPLSDPLKVSNLTTHPAYKIINVKKSNIGNYTCSVRNEINRTVYTDAKIVFLNITGECRCRWAGQYT